MVQGKFETITVVATADFSTEALQYLIVNAAGAIATGENDALGIMQDRPLVGDHATLAWSGHMKGRAEGVIAKGVPIMVGTNGRILAATGATRPAMGMSLTAAVAGDIFEFVGNFATARVLA